MIQIQAVGTPAGSTYISGGNNFIVFYDYSAVASSSTGASRCHGSGNVKTVKKLATAKFDETIEVHIKTGCDGRHADQQIRGAVVLPHGTGKQVRVLVFAKGAKADEAVAAGAEFVGAEELIPRIQNGCCCRCYP